MSVADIRIGRWYAISNPYHAKNRFADRYLRVKIAAVSDGYAEDARGRRYPLFNVIRTWADEERRVKAICEEAEAATLLLGVTVRPDTSQEMFDLRVTRDQLRALMDDATTAAARSDDALADALGV